MAPPTHLAIVQTDSTVTLTRPDGRALLLYFDGRPAAPNGQSGDSAPQVTARWERRRFVVRRAMADRGAITESYELADDGRKLIVQVQLPDRGRGVAPSFRRVYDLVTRSME